MAINLDISSQILCRRVKGAENEHGHAFRSDGKFTPKQEEIRRLNIEYEK